MTRLEEILKSRTHILWDWNGTLLDDVDLCVETISTLLKQHGLNLIDREDYRKRFRFPVIEYYKSLGFNFEKTPFQQVGDEWMRLYRENLAKCKLHQGAKELLAELYSQGKIQSILSAAKETDLLHQLDHFGIRSYFHHVYGINNHYAHGKIDRGRELIEKLGVEPKQMILIGDTDHDCEVAEALGVDLLLLGDGHQHHERLTDLGAQLLPCRHSSPLKNK